VQTDLARVFELSQLTGEEPQERFLPRFSQLVFIIQIPRLDVYEEVAKIKGAALTDLDRQEIDLRIKYAKKWLETFAPDRYRYVLQEQLPEAAKELSEIQKEFLSSLAGKLESIEWDGETMHGAIHEIVKSNENFSPKDCFQAIYKLFLGKDFGPQAGWFLSALERDFVLSRLERER
ncbi:MAG: hypothetical protein OEY44_01250, partial [Candidatus Peregrinibacteria bacterium]|nr:hypothetical protein [Candidatus Peregrinibacteria bacterium]